jgi:restriction endonuclease S subunit
MRMNHVNADNIDAIIGLGRNLFYNSGLESFIMICNNNKPEWRRGNILFIEAEKLTHKEGKQAYLHKEDIEQIVNAYNNPNDIIGLSKYVTNEEIIKNGGNLNIKSYVKDSSKEIENGDPIKELNVNRRFLWDTLAKLEDRNINENIQEISSITKLEKTNWNKVCLADVAEAYSESIKNPSESEYEYFIGSDCIGQYDFRIGKRQPSSGVTSAQKLFKKGDYLLVRRSLYGSDFRERAPRADFDGICSADIITIREKDNIAPGFLIWVLYQKELWDYIVSNSTGGLTRRIKWKDLANYEFTLPSLSEQKVLADKLWAAYRVKESYKKLLAATDDILKAKFMEMFGGQGVVTLSEACDIVMGTSPDSQYYNTNCEGLPFYQGKTEFTDMYIGGAEVWCTKPIRVAEKNEILMSVRAPVGAINIAAEKCCIGRGLCSIKPKDNVTKLLFVFYALKLQEEEISRLGTGSTFKAVNKDQVYNKITLPLPPLPLQQQFVEIATQAEATKESLCKSIENIDQVIKSLINQ